MVGVWGHGPFDNDDALDWVRELSKSGDLGFPAVVLQGLDLAGQVSRREGNAGIAAAEAVAASRGRPYEPLQEEIQQWLEATAAYADARTTRLALRVISKIEGDPSELRLLWDEAPDGPSWHEAVGDLRRRLQAPARKVGLLPRTPRLRVRLGDVVQLTSAGKFFYIQLIGKMEPAGDLIRVIPGFFDLPLDEAGLAVLVGGETAFLSGGIFEGMLTTAGGLARGNYPVPATCAAPQPLRFRMRQSGTSAGWGVKSGGSRMSAEEFARLYPDIDQTMLADSASIPFPDTLLRMIECEWRPWMGDDLSWMYPEDSEENSPPARPSPYPLTAVPGKFLIE